MKYKNIIFFNKLKAIKITLENQIRASNQSLKPHELSNSKQINKYAERLKFLSNLPNQKC